MLLEENFVKKIIEKQFFIYNITRSLIYITFSEVGSDNGKMSMSKKEWTEENMDAALDALRNHHMSLTKASITFGIPSTTLWQRAHRLGIDTPKKDGPSKSWNEEVLNVALDALRTGSLSANKASKAYGNFLHKS